MLATAMSRNYPLPDHTGKPTRTSEGPGTVLMVAMEDNLGAVIIPRLKRLGADLDKITFANECKDNDGNPRPFTLADLPLLTTYMHTPSNLVVAHWTSDVESTAPLGVLLRHDLWTPFWCLISCKIRSIISVACDFTTQSWGI